MSDEIFRPLHSLAEFNRIESVGSEQFNDFFFCRQALFLTVGKDQNASAHLASDSRLSRQDGLMAPVDAVKMTEAQACRFVHGILLEKSPLRSPAGDSISY